MNNDKLISFNIKYNNKEIILYYAALKTILYFYLRYLRLAINTTWRIIYN